MTDSDDDDADNDSNDDGDNDDDDDDIKVNWSDPQRNSPRCDWRSFRVIYFVHHQALK